MDVLRRPVVANAVAHANTAVRLDHVESISQSVADSTIFNEVRFGSLGCDRPSPMQLTWTTLSKREGRSTQELSEGNSIRQFIYFEGA